MNSVLKLMTLFLVVAFIVSCGDSDDISLESGCSRVDEMSAFTNKIKFEEYYKYGSIKFNQKYDENSLLISKDSIIFIDKFAFSETGNFSYLRIAYPYGKIDTIEILNGKYKTYKDGEFSWYVLKLEADSIYKKDFIYSKDTAYFSPEFIATKFSGLSDSLLTDVGNWVPSGDSYLWETDSTCFKLHLRGYPPFLCEHEYVPGAPTRTFCLKQPEEIENE